MGLPYIDTKQLNCKMLEMLEEQARTARRVSQNYYQEEQARTAKGACQICWKSKTRVTKQMNC